MPSYKNFQSQRVKNSKKSSDIFSRPKDMTRRNEISEERRKNLIDWITMYRRNVHRFVSHYFGIELYFYQKIWLYLMGTRDSFAAICSRATAKTWLVAVLALARGVLYPNSEIVVVASTKQQAGILVEDKIVSLRDNYPNVAREIRNVTTNLNRWQVDLHNGSVIKIVASRDSSRGKRATFLVYEEFRLIDKEVVDAVIRPFAYIRQTPYLKNPEFSHLGEEPKEIFISSAYHKGLWWFEETKKIIRQMLRGENAGFIAFDTTVAVTHHIKTPKQIKNEISKMDRITALEEYGNIPFGENSTSYYKLKMFTRAQTISKAFYPQRTETYNAKKNPYGIPRTDGEIRLVSCDIAQRAGRENDLAITTCIRLLPTHKGYTREPVYIESFSGENTISQGLRIKQVYHDFDADVVVLDIQGSGVSVYDQLGVITKDTERGIEYPAMTIMPHSSIDEETYRELANRTLGINGIPVVYPISGSARLNSQIYVELRDKLQRRMFAFLVDEIKAEDYLMKMQTQEFLIDDDSSRSFFLAPYVQTALLINESINLSMVLTAGNIKLVEPPGSRKDRFTSLAYGNYYASLLDAELLKQEDGSTDLESLLKMTYVK